MSTGNHHENHHENHQNSSILLDSLKEFDVELTQRNAAALNDLNRQIDELSEIPIDSSTLPRYKDSLAFDSLSAAHKTPLPVLENQLKKLDNFNNYNAPSSSSVPINTATFSGPADHVDLLLQVDREKEELEKKMADILDMSKPFKSAAKGTETPISPMDFGTDSIAKDLMDSSFAIPLQGNSSLIEADDISNRLKFLTQQTTTTQPESRRNPSIVSSTRHEYKLPIPSAASESNGIAQLPLPAPVPSVAPTRPIAVDQPSTNPVLENNDLFGDSSLDDNRAIINALRTLQDRVGKLENEKAAAKQKIVLLEHELSTTRSLLVHQQQSNQRTYSNEPAHQEYKPKPVSETRPSLPIPDRTTESTLRNITQARQKVGNLQQEVARLELLGGGDHARSEGVPDPSILLAKTPSEFINPSQAFEDILEKHSLTSSVAAVSGVFKSKSPEMPRKKVEIAPELPKRAWSATGPLAKSSPSKLDAANEIKNLQKEILVDREIRTNSDSLSYDPQVIKERVLEKLKSASGPIKQDSTKKTAVSVPTWKKTEQKRSKSASKLNEKTTHVRKRAPIEIPTVPNVVPAEGGGGREMPFIVGRNTGKSFSVTANLQRVFSLLKSHNPEMCSTCSKKHPPNTKHIQSTSTESISKAVHVLDHQEPKKVVKPRATTSAKQTVKSNEAIYTSGITPVTNEDIKKAAGDNNESLYHILGVLEDEYTEAKTHYTQLVKQYETVANSMTSQVISESTGSTTLKAIGDDLRHVIQNMEAKSDQIGILRDIITSSKSMELKRDKALRKKPVSSNTKRYTMATATSRSRAASAVDSRSSLRRSRSLSPGRAMSLLKSSLKVQNALDLK